MKNIKSSFFYRVEHELIEYDEFVFAGPYSDIVDIHDWCEERWLHSDDKHPEPYADEKLISNPDFSMEGMYCGFKTLTQLKKWFKQKELRNLKKLGFVIVKYESSNYMIGNSQVIFSPAQAQKRIIINQK